ncbi:MATE family efflux transporter [Desulfoplanes formicivorans]|uniref:Multidrug-efflux transporter n=1 Tax=Desulfoplanes formicivorans TaxID=1592317 RepID=A0A194AFC6_9BACT|nr:MATE family efflux transporter [Desulfoplanes formicivorans]GAU07900.1 MATE efflux family protein [Desulfoplanes formicivorans]
MYIMHTQQKRTGPHGEVIRVSFPLVLSMGATTVMEFTDRVFLGRYSLDALAAAVPSGLMALLVMSVFIGTGGYVSVFVAQYTGAGRLDKVGRVLWQGVYFALAATVVFVACSFVGDHVFDLMNHSPEVKKLEVVYFSILCLFAGFQVLGAVFSGFFMGLGRTRPVMLVTLFGMCLNIPLDYCLINGVWLFPQWGMQGAAVATGMSWVVVATVLGCLVFSPGHGRDFSLFASVRPDATLFKRLVRFGFPNGFQFFLDIFAFTVFTAIVGHIGVQELAATNIVLNINGIAFMPLVGFSLGTSILVGQALGGGNPPWAERVTMASMQIAAAYTVCVGIIYLIFPEALLGLFKPVGFTAGEYAYVMETGKSLLYIVLVYLGFDVMTFVFAGALKGAGDTAFIMKATAVAALGCMLVPLSIGILWLGLGLWFAWSCVLCYIVFLSLCMLVRYHLGRWREMLVID